MSAAIGLGLRDTLKRLCRLPWRGGGYGVATTLSLLALSAIGVLPLFGEPGYEFALAAGLVLPSIMAVATAAVVGRSREHPLESLFGALSAAALVALLGAGIAFAHGLRTTLCDPWRGLAIYTLGGGGGALMGALWGTWVGLAVRRRSLRRRWLWTAALALAGPAAGIGTSLWRFYASPMVFAFDPFFGYFAGPLYDTVLDPLGPLASYRIGSLFTVLASALLFSQLEQLSGGQWRLCLRLPLLPFLAVSVLVSAGLTFAGTALGHFSTVSSIRDELSVTTRSGRCLLYHRPHQPTREMAVLAKDCSATLARLEAWFDLPSDGRDVAVFVFSSPGDKGRLMGASRTYVAKPWRREIYLNAQGFPHPVLPHELAHVVAGRFGQGPFHVAGPLWGILPDPGRIEGFAVAAAPHAESVLSLEDAARAMQALELLPPLKDLFALSFLGYGASAGYTAAGAFVSWLKAEVGPRALRTWYSGASLESATGTPLQTLEKRWHQRLAAVQVSKAQLDKARDAFLRPAIFGRRCPRLVDKLRGEAARDLVEGAVAEAEARYRKELFFDTHSLSAQLGLAACAMRRDKLQEAEDQYQVLLGQQSLSELDRAVVLEALGDLWLARGSLAQARAKFAEAATAYIDEGALRSLEVKRQADTLEARRALIALLLGDRTGQAWPEAVEALLRWSERAPGVALPEYLLGKNWFTQGKYELAAEHLDAALQRGGLSRFAMREAHRVRLLAACTLGDRMRFEALAVEQAALATSTADVARHRELVLRCRGVLEKTEQPSGGGGCLIQREQP